MAKTYLESIQHFPKETQEWLIREAPHSAMGLRSVPDQRFDSCSDVPSIWDSRPRTE